VAKEKDVEMEEWIWWQDRAGIINIGGGDRGDTHREMRG
jgi:hypothetical protein